MRSALVALFLGLPACVGLSPREDPPPATPDILVSRVRGLTVDERWSALYDLLSARRREEISRLEFVIGFSSYTVAPGYKVTDVIKSGRFLGAIENANGDKGLVYYTYSEPGKPKLDAEVEVVCEDGAWKLDGVR
jgi:hypothetical protein